MSPTECSLKHLRENGWTPWRVEHWNAFSRRRVDLYGFGDLIAYHPTAGISIIQTTSGSNAGARYAKIVASEHALGWLEAGGRNFLHSVAKRGARGKRKLWSVVEREITALEIRAQRDELLA